MNENKSDLGGYFSIAAGVSYIIVGITFFQLPEIQRGSSIFRDVKDYLISVAADPSTLAIQYWFFGLAAIMGMGVIVALKRYMKSEGQDILNWANVLGLVGYAFMCANFTRLAYLLPLRAKRFAEGGEQLQQAMLGSNNLSLDPTAILGFGFVGLWFLVTNYIAMNNDSFKKELAYIGMLGGILHILVPIGTVFNEQILVSVAAGLGGVVLGPIWYIWLGLTMQKKV